MQRVAFERGGRNPAFGASEHLQARAEALRKLRPSLKTPSIGPITVQPTLDIQKIQPDLFTYALAAAAAPGRPCGNFFITVVSVLHDAGRLLSRYFDCVEIRLAGFALGSYPVAQLVQDPASVFKALMGRMGEIVAMTESRHTHPPETHEAPRSAGRHSDRFDL